MFGLRSWAVSSRPIIPPKNLKKPCAVLGINDFGEFAGQWNAPEAGFSFRRDSSGVIHLSGHAADVVERPAAGGDRRPPIREGPAR